MIVQWFEQYGYWVLFIGLLLEYIALPFPGETTMTYAGFLSYSGYLSWPITVLVSAAGTTIGISITYWIGRRFGTAFFDRFGKYLLLPPAKLQKAGGWFNKHGNKIIFIAYFIPGLRHFTGYFSGIVRLPFRTFALYAYSGACFWVLTFPTLGYWLGPNWELLHKLASHPKIRIFLILAAVVVVSVWLGIKFRKQLAELLSQTVRWLNRKL